MDTTLPMVGHRFTARHKANPAPNSSDITIAFDEEMYPDTSQRLIQIVPPVSGNNYFWNANRTMLTFNPDAGLANNTRYAVTVFDQVSDAVGNTLAQPYNFRFTALLPPPTLVSSVPGSRGKGIRRDTNIVLTFDQPMHPDQMGEIQMERLIHNPNLPPRSLLFPIPATTTVNGRMVTVNPDSNLQSGSSYVLDYQKAKSADGTPAGRGAWSTFAFNTLKTTP